MNKENQKDLTEDIPMVKLFTDKIKNKIKSFSAIYLPLILLVISLLGGVEQFVRLYLLSPDLLIFYSVSQIVINGIFNLIVIFFLMIFSWILICILRINKKNHTILLSLIFMILLISMPFINGKIFSSDHSNSIINIKKYAINNENEEYYLVYYNDKYAFYEKSNIVKNYNNIFIVKDINDVLDDYNVVYYKNESEKRKQKK